MLVRLVEVVGVDALVDGQGQEQRAEEHDLRDEKRPHTHDVRLVLLFQILELMGYMLVHVPIVCRFYVRLVYPHRVPSPPRVP